MFQENPVREWGDWLGKGRRSDKGASPGTVLGKVALVPAGVRKQWRSHSRRLFITLHPVLGGVQSRALPAPEGSPLTKSRRCGLSGVRAHGEAVHKNSQGSRGLRPRTDGSWRLLTSAVGEGPGSSHAAVGRDRVASIHTTEERGAS